MVPYVGASYRRQSDSPSDLNGDPRTNRPGYGILNLNAGVEAADGKWQLEVFVKNERDEVLTPGVITATLTLAS